MKSRTRRTFLLALSAGGSALAMSDVLAQAALPKLDEKDPTALALGYVADSTKADKKKFPNYAADQKCNACQLFVGKGKDPFGACPIFAGKQVAAAGWCSAYIKKA